MNKRLKVKVAYDMVSNKPLKESKLTTADKDNMAQMLEAQIVEALTSKLFSIENVEVSLETIDEGDSELHRRLS